MIPLALGLVAGALLMWVGIRYEEVRAWDEFWRRWR